MSNRIDGALFVNLADEDFRDMGIHNRFHLKKLELILKSYRIRYQRKKERRIQQLQNGGGPNAQEAEEDEEDLISGKYHSDTQPVLFLIHSVRICSV
jgi:hypothetical protein